MLSELLDPGSDVEFVFEDNDGNEVQASIAHTKQRAMQHLFNTALRSMHRSSTGNMPAVPYDHRRANRKRKRAERLPHGDGVESNENSEGGDGVEGNENSNTDNNDSESYVHGSESNDDSTSCDDTDDGESGSNDHDGDADSEDDDNSDNDNSSNDDNNENDDDDTRRGHSQRHGTSNGQQTSSSVDACFLCTYCTTNEVKCVTSFICDNIANMDVGFMAQQIREFIFEQRPELLLQQGQGQGQNSRMHGLDVSSIRKHIRLHMLSPTVRIADMMRHLLSLCDTLRNNLYREDPDTGDTCADRGNIDTYLKIVTQVLNMYKMSEPSKMLFAHADKS